MPQELSLQEQLKQDLMAQVRKVDINQLHKIANPADTVTLCHGTITPYLNSILENGVLPRDMTGNDNWEAEKASSNEGVVYLSNKWQYFYAYNAVEKQLTEKYGEEWSSNPKAQWWLTLNPCPVYIECKVPKAYLTIDEDIVYTKFVKDQIKNAIKRDENLQVKVTWEDSLAHLGTVGVIGGIRKEWITSFTLLGDGELYLALMGDRSIYRKEHKKWLEGKGKGKLKPADLKAIEHKYKRVGTINVKQLPKGYKVSQVYFNKEEQQMAVILNTPEEYLQQPNKLEVF